MGAVMLMFWNEKLVILQVPKTGSTALEAALAPRTSMHISHPPQMRHLTYRRYAYRFAPFFENFDPTPMEVLAVLRNPVDWVGSWYRYYLGSKFDGTDHSTLGLTFSDFVDAVMAGSDAPYAQIGTQSAMIAPPRPKAARIHCACSLMKISRVFWHSCPSVFRRNCLPPNEPIQTRGFGNISRSARGH